MATKYKDVDVTVEIDASPEDVWTAISEGEQVGRWFPLNAEIEPGVGGKYRIDWGPDMAGQGTITAWDEGVRIAYQEQYPGSEEQEVPVAVEYTIESRDGKTYVRMVNSGFSAEDDWAEMVDTIDSGWRYFMWNLKVYVERHFGTARRMVWDRRRIGVDKAEAWSLITGTDGLAAIDGDANEGAPVTLWSGHAGATAVANAPMHYAARIGELNDALLLIELEPGQGQYSMGVWLSLYGVDDGVGDAVEARLAERLDQLFPAVSS